MREFKIYPSNLRRLPKKDTNNRTNLIYVRVNLIFQPSLATGKPRIELKKVNKSIYVSLYFNLIFFPKIMSRSKTGRSKDHILQSFGVVELIECVDLSVEHRNFT